MSHTVGSSPTTCFKGKKIEVERGNQRCTQTISRRKPIAMAVLLATTCVNRVHGMGTPNPGGGWSRRSDVSTFCSETNWLPTKWSTFCFCLAGVGLKQRGQRLARRVLVLPSSEFEHLFEEGPTELAYAGTPAGRIKKYEQGRLGRAWARKVLREKNPKSEILDPEPGTCSDGRMRRGSYHAEYDFLLNGQKVEVKSARMTWYSMRGYWHLRFKAVKLPYGERTEAAFDDLYLVIMSPKGLHLIKHDLVTGVNTQGKATEVEGYDIRVCGNTGTTGWEDALDEMLEKLCVRGGCRVVDEQAFGELKLEEMLSNRVSPGQAAVAGLPMSSMSGEKRGKRMEEIGLAIDRRLNPCSDFTCVKGNCYTNAPVDWVRDTCGVELKSCRLTFCRSKNLWQCFFQHIKTDLFDELWLAIYTSVGIHYYQCKSCKSLGFHKAGVATKVRGHNLPFHGPRGELDPLAALKTIQTQMRSSGCELITIVEW